MIRTYVPNMYSERKFSKGENKMTFIKNNSYLLVAFALFILLTFVTIKKLEQEVVYEQRVVAEGDTLWAYSQEYAGAMPTEKWIDEIIVLNNLPSVTIKTGEKLRIPVSPKYIEHNDIATNLVEETE